MHLALLIDPEDSAYLPYVKSILAGHKVSVLDVCPDMVAELTLRVDGVICCQEAFLHKVTGRRGTIDDYAGSLFWRNGKPILIVDPIKQLMTVPHGEFIFRRFVSKLLRPEMWQSAVPFNWEELKDGDRFIELYNLAKVALAISVDVETAPSPLRIQICSYSIVSKTWDGKINLVNFTFGIDSPERYRWMELLNALPVPKVMQNGIYDSSWFIYYGCPPNNWCFDTQDLFHSWYSELPKALAFVTAFCVRDTYYWKKDGKTGIRDDFLRYGCMDTWATSCSWLYLMEALPDWAWENYLLKFPLNFPSLLCGLRGWKIDQERRANIRSEQIPEIEDNRKLLRQITGKTGFNPGSWQQVKPVLQILNTKPKLKVDSTDKKMVEKVSSQHAFNQLVCNAIRDYKLASKLLSSYIDAELLHGRFLFTLAPSGTDTARMASHGSVFWTGNSIQTIPRGSVIKSMFVADEGYYLGEPDAEQAEARCVAYLSGDENLIATVESPRDYHKQNAEKFFGVPYDEISEEIRDLSKRTNHGANYNMGDNVLLQTMGIRNIIKAQRLLKLPTSWSLKQVAHHLLETYAATYPQVKGDWYSSIQDQIQTIHKLISPLGWTRFFFGKPWLKERKPDLNAAVAHAPQNLNVGIINESFLKLYQLEKKTGGDFKLLAQIHDSIPFQYRIGRLDLACEAARIMEVAYPIRDCKGTVRSMLIPIKLKAEGSRWSELKVIPDFRITNKAA